MPEERVTEVGLKALVESGPVLPEHFYVGRSSAPPPAEAPAGGVVIKNLALSVDPYMRGRMRDVKGYLLDPFAPGQPIDSGCVARVVHSNFDGLVPGDLVQGLLPWQEHVTLGPDAVRQLTKINNTHNFPVSYFIGAMGMPGFTAWGSLQKIASPKPGETAFISGAAGAVGMLVGQLLKVVYGCKVVGSAGSDDKVAFLTKELGFDAAFNYKTVPVREGLAKYCPEGINIYFDNVGGETLEAVLDACSLHARVVACGAISQYDASGEERYGVKNLANIVFKRIRMEGFIVFDWYADLEFLGKFVHEMADLISSKRIKVVEHTDHGLENAGKAFVDMMSGRSVGKAVVLLE